MSVVEAGTLLAIQKGGILGVPYSDQSVLSTKYEGGTVHSPNAAAEGARRKALMGHFSQTKSRDRPPTCLPWETRSIPPRSKSMWPATRFPWESSLATLATRPIRPPTTRRRWFSSSPRGLWQTRARVRWKTSSGSFYRSAVTMRSRVAGRLETISKATSRAAIRVQLKDKRNSKRLRRSRSR